MVKFKCPLCDPVVILTRSDQFALDIAIAAHIIHHEDEASLRAVDRARLGCQQVACSLGGGRMYHRENGFEYRLTDYDEKFLSGIRIKK